MRALLALLAMSLALPALAARGDRLAIPVSATVMARMKLKLHDHPPALTVGREDLRRGYVVVTGARIEAGSNSRQSMSLQVQVDPEVASGVHIDGVGAGVLAHDAAPRPVTYRITLADGLQPGTYPWPVALSLHGLP